MKLATIRDSWTQIWQLHKQPTKIFCTWAAKIIKTKALKWWQSIFNFTGLFVKSQSWKDFLMNLPIDNAIAGAMLQKTTSCCCSKLGQLQVFSRGCSRWSYKIDQISRLNTNDDKFCVVKLFQAGKGRPKLSYFTLKCAIIFYIPT